MMTIADRLITVNDFRAKLIDMEPWQRLARLIEYTGVKQSVLARRMGRDPQWVNDRVLGKTGLAIEDVTAFAGAFRMDVVDFARLLLTDEPPGRAYRPASPGGSTSAYPPVPLHHVPVPIVQETRIGAFAEHYARSGEGLPDVTPESATISKVAELIIGLGQQLRQDRSRTG